MIACLYKGTIETLHIIMDCIKLQLLNQVIDCKLLNEILWLIKKSSPIEERNINRDRHIAG